MKLWEYVKGSLEGEELRDVERMLRRNPDKRAEVHRMTHQQKILDQVDTTILSEPVPQRLKDVIERARKRKR